MSHDRKANLVRRLARRRGDIDRHAQHARLAHLGRIEHTARYEQLNASAPRAYRSRTCSAASTGLLATWANKPAPWRPAP